MFHLWNVCCFADAAVKMESVTASWGKSDPPVITKYAFLVVIVQFVICVYRSFGDILSCVIWHTVTDAINL